MSISLSFLILGILIIIVYSLALLDHKRKCPERKMDYISAFEVYLVGILFILGAITDGYIRIIILSTTIMLLAFSLLYSFKYLNQRKDI